MVGQGINLSNPGLEYKVVYLNKPGLEKSLNWK